MSPRLTKRKTDLRLCCKACVACRLQYTQQLQPSETHFGQSDVTQSHDGLSHYHGTNSEMQERPENGLKHADKLRALRPDVQAEVHVLLGKHPHVEVKDQLDGCTDGSQDLDFVDMLGSLVTVAASVVFEVAAQCQFAEVIYMALFHIHISLGQWDFCSCF